MSETGKKKFYWSFEDFDSLTEAAKGWNLDLYKLSPEPFRGKGIQFFAESFIFSYARFHCHLRQIGHPPLGYRTITVPVNPDMRMLWQGHHVSGNDLLVHPKGQLDAISNNNFEVYSISYPESIFDDAVVKSEFPGVKEKLQKQAVFRCKRDRIDDLIPWLKSYHRLFWINPDAMRWVQGEITRRIICLLASATNEVVSQPTARRINAIHKAEAYIFEHADDPPSVEDILKTTGVSKRTLEYAFYEYFGMNPKSYINAIRLNAVRKQLRAAEPGRIRVADAANFWGFWHMGQFAADYRKLFGVSPSITLKQPSILCKVTCPFLKKCGLCGRIVPPPEVRRVRTVAGTKRRLSA